MQAKPTAYKSRSNNNAAKQSYYQDHPKGFTQIPNTLIQDSTNGKLTPAEFRVVATILRYLYKESARISIATIAKTSGFRSERYVRKIVKSLSGKIGLAASGDRQILTFRLPQIASISGSTKPQASGSDEPQIDPSPVRESRSLRFPGAGQVGIIRNTSNNKTSLDKHNGQLNASLNESPFDEDKMRSPSNKLGPSGSIAPQNSIGSSEPQHNGSSDEDLYPWELPTIDLDSIEVPF